METVMLKEINVTSFSESLEVTSIYEKENVWDNTLYVLSSKNCRKLHILEYVNYIQIDLSFT